MDKIDVVRAVVEAAAQGDTEAVLARYHADVVWDVSRGPLADLTPAGVYHGHDGLRAFFRNWQDAWEDPGYVVEEMREAGEAVVTVGRLTGRGRSSGLELEGPGQAALWTVRAGKVARVVWFGSLDEALRQATGG